MAREHQLILPDCPIDLSAPYFYAPSVVVGGFGRAQLQGNRLQSDSYNNDVMGIAVVKNKVIIKPESEFADEGFYQFDVYFKGSYSKGKQRLLTTLRHLGNGLELQGIIDLNEDQVALDQRLFGEVYCGGTIEFIRPQTGERHSWFSLPDPQELSLFKGSFRNRLEIVGAS